MKQLPPKKDSDFDNDLSQITVLFQDRRLRPAPGWLKWCRRQPEWAVGAGGLSVVCWVIGGLVWETGSWPAEFTAGITFMLAGGATLATALAYFVAWLETVEPRNK